MLLQRPISQRAQARPEAVAVVLKGARLTYGELEASSNRLAHLLFDAGVRRGDRVALLVPKVPEAIVAMLATLKLGAIYVPLDPQEPEARLAVALETADCRCLLGAGPAGAKLRGARGRARLKQRLIIGWLEHDAPQELYAEFTLRDRAAYPASTPANGGSPGDIAHILFTSGSTGTPKGVTITHENVARFLDWAMPYFGLGPEDRVGQHAPLRFDLSTFDIFGALWAGAQVHLVPAELNLLPHRLVQFMRESALTHWLSVPTILNLVAKFDALRPDDLPALRRVLWGGEVLPTPTLIYWMRRLPRAAFTNLYGPTEATIFSSYYTVPHCPEDARASIPIGAPCGGEELLILDEKLQPVPEGTLGDLYIAGCGLSPGYWREPGKTAAAFLPRPGGAGEHERIYRTGDVALRGEDGQVYFHGRRDTQVKSRGYRIELGEIEAALAALSGLRESAVVAIPTDGVEGVLICCAYVPTADAAPAEQVRAGLARLLPGYMLPARWMRCEALPRNPSGKVDRPRLVERFQHLEAAPAQLARSAA